MSETNISNEQRERADRVKEIRLELGLTSAAFARQCGEDPTNYSPIETGRRDISEKVVMHLMSQGYSYHWIMYGKGSKKTPDYDAITKELSEIKSLLKKLLKQQAV